MGMAEVEAAAERLCDLEARRDMIEVEIQALRALLAQAMDVGEVVEVHGKPMYALRPGKRTFQQDIALRLLAGSSLMDEVKVVKIDGPTLKTLSEGTWQACCTTGQPYVQAVR